MRTLRYALVVGSLAGVAAPAGAQSSEQFRDSWFWGAKAGVASLATPETPRTARPTWGADWLVTRTRAALYLSADVSYFDMIGTVRDPSSPTGLRSVDASNLRRFGFAALAFPRTFGAARPYAGIGLALNVVGRVSERPDTTGSFVPPISMERLDEARSRAAFQAMAGVQANVGRVAAFAQVTAMPGSRRFVLDDKALQFLEIGVRYRVGSAIDRPGRNR